MARARSPVNVVNAILLACTLGLGPAALAAEAQNAPILTGGDTRDIRDDVMYQVMPDRFANGDPRNDYGDYESAPGVDRDAPDQVALHGLRRDDPGFFHGGDLRGLTARLPYIRGLGATAIWTTPIMKNRPTNGQGTSSNYHGYAVTDFLAVDPHFGSDRDLHRYVERAHASGIKVILDTLINHSADVYGYAECGGGGCAYVPKGDLPYTALEPATGQRRAFDDADFAFAFSRRTPFPALDADSFPLTPVARPGRENLRNPPFLNDPTLYHNRGGRDGSAESEIQGELFDLDDFFTLHPKMLGGLVDIYRYWVREFAIDGLRLDAARHVELEFHRQWWPRVAAAARRPDFFGFGEVFVPGAEEKGRYVRRGGLPAVLDFGFRAAVLDVLSAGRPTSILAQTFADDDNYIDADSSAYTLPTFLSNHDAGRFAAFLRRDNPGASEDELLARSLLAHALLFTARGIPIVYYGDEQGFTGLRPGGNAEAEAARQDMFPSRVPEYRDPAQNRQLGVRGTPADDNFDVRHPLYRGIHRLAELRAAVRPLRRGAQLARWSSDEPGGGLFAFSRIERGDDREVLVVFNTHASQPRSAEIPTLHGSTRFEELTQKGGRHAAHLRSARDGRLRVSVDPLDFVVLRAERPLEPRRRAPRVAITAPNRFAGGDFFVEAELSEQAFAEVDFFARTPDGRTRFLGRDDNAPYRVRFDSRDVALGSDVTLWARVRDHSGNQAESERVSLRVESRLESVVLHYENGNRRTGVFTLLPSGEASLPRDFADSTYRVDDPAGFQQATFFFESRDAQGRASGFDAPFTLTRDAVLANAQLTATGLRAELFLNDAGELSDAPNGDGAALPEVLELDPAAPDPIGVPLFVRGSNNGFGTSDALRYAGGYTFQGRTQFAAAGRYALKFADAGFSPATNFGAPFGADGVSVGPDTGNLAVQIDLAGRYEVQLFAVPRAGRTLRFFRLSPAPVLGPIDVLLHYENGNARDSLFAFLPSGELLPPRPLVASTHAFRFPAEAGQLTFFFESSDARGRATGFDAPFTLAYDAVVDAAQPSAGGLRAELWLNDALELSDTPNDDGAGVPAVLPLLAGTADPFAVPLFVRGTMNGFGTSEPLVYQGDGSYAGTTRIPAPGRYELKLADAGFSPGANLGAPFGAEGISVGPFTGNLPVQLAQAGDYDVQLFALPLDGRVLRFWRLSAPLP